MDKAKIYSFSERNNLRQTAMELADYCKASYDVKQIKDISFGMARRFMKEKAKTCNQTTLNNISSRLNKLEKLDGKAILPWQNLIMERR